MGEAGLLQRGLRLEYATLGWNVIGVIVVAVAALAARSVALAGFGLDSLIEIFASVVVVWQLKGVNKHREQQALRMIGIAFFGLALYVVVQGGYVILTRYHPSPSAPGIAWL